jgi:hypothetical protein
MLYASLRIRVIQIAYLKSGGYPIPTSRWAEEPGRTIYVAEDYGALYLQWATALHKLDPNDIGGPVFEGVKRDIQVWPDAPGRTSWLGRFFSYFEIHDLGCRICPSMSFDHYPYQPCTIQLE